LGKTALISDLKYKTVIIWDAGSIWLFPRMPRVCSNLYEKKKQITNFIKKLKGKKNLLKLDFKGMFQKLGDVPFGPFIS
jgi:hypothetical protein